MPLAPLLKLPKTDQQEFLNDLNYLNTSEIQSFCKRQSIPYTIAIATEKGGRKNTTDSDRKGVILERIRDFLRTGVVPGQTCFPATVACFEPLPVKLTADDRLFYGQYDKSSQAMTALLKNLTGGQFRNGAIARILARQFWSRGSAPTFKEYAAAWLHAVKEHTRPNPEWAFLSDRAGKSKARD
jgi:hypothetical protein